MLLAPGGIPHSPPSSFQRVSQEHAHESARIASRQKHTIRPSCEARAPCWSNSAQDQVGLAASPRPRNLIACRSTGSCQNTHHVARQHNSQLSSSSQQPESVACVRTTGERWRGQQEHGRRVRLSHIASSQVSNPYEATRFRALTGDDPTQSLVIAAQAQFILIHLHTRRCGRTAAWPALMSPRRQAPSHLCADINAHAPQAIRLGFPQDSAFHFITRRSTSPLLCFPHPHAPTSPRQQRFQPCTCWDTFALAALCAGVGQCRRAPRYEAGKHLADVLNNSGLRAASCHRRRGHSSYQPRGLPRWHHRKSRAPTHCLHLPRRR